MLRRPSVSHVGDRSDAGGAARSSSEGVSGRTESASSTRAARGVARFLVVLALLGSIQLLVMLGVEAYRAVEGQRAIVRLQGDIADLRAEAAALEAVVEHAGDHDYREQLARRRGFIYPDETRVVPLR